VNIQNLGNRLGLAVASIGLAVLLVIAFKAPDDAGAAALIGGSNSSGTGSNSAANQTGTGSSSSSHGSGSGNGSGSGGTSGGSQTIDGPVINTRYGPVQVEIHVDGGRIASISALELPSGGRSGMISSYVEPVLQSEALSAQSASINLISGATYTSIGYARSLQAALDQAGL
jgi:FMN-binding domain